MDKLALPIFPLPMVVFPEGEVSLRIFEPRYLDMVRDCARQQSSFVICSVLNKAVSDDRPRVCALGTEVKIADFDVLPDGLLGIVVKGLQRVHVGKTTARHDGLLIGNIERIGADPSCPVPPQYSLLADLVAGIYTSRGASSLLSPINLDNAHWIAYRLAELLPIEVDERQQILELESVMSRLQFLLELLPRFQRDDDD
jgi:uncharacterized protein